MSDFPMINMGLRRSTLRLAGQSPKRLHVDLGTALRCQLFKLEHARCRNHILSDPALHRALSDATQSGDVAWATEWGKGVSDGEHSP